MKFSKENLKAVEDRFLEYENSIGSGGHVEVGDCTVCKSVIKGNDRDCRACVLSGMKINRGAIDPVAASCLTTLRSDALTRNRKVVGTVWQGYHKYSVKHLKARLKEMRDHVKEQLK